MSTITAPETAVIDQRVKALVAISYTSGIRRIERLNQDTTEAFGLTLDYPEKLIKQLGLMRFYLAPSSSLEAAYYALGIDALGESSERRSALLTERHGPGWDENLMSLLLAEEKEGFTALASAWELVIEFKKVAESFDNLAELAGAALRGGEKTLRSHEANRLNYYLSRPKVRSPFAPKVTRQKA